MTADLFEVISATWPAAQIREEGVWRMRDGAGGGKRVSAVTLHGALPDVLPDAELFSVREGQDDLDAALATRGYEVYDPSLLFSCPIGHLADQELPRITAFDIWPPLQIMCDLWTAASTGPARQAVMARAQCPKTSILGRISERAGGMCYAGLHDGVTMVHALEIVPEQRRKGLARHMMVKAAQWGVLHGADTFSVVTTKENTGAQAFYTALGMTGAGRYHYRIKPLEGPK